MFFLTIVYGSPQSKYRKELWRELGIIYDTMCNPWVVGGDFNAILKKEEKMGGLNAKIHSCKKFGSWVQDCNMNDMGFVGSRFTWKRGMVQERLDRFLCNDVWQGKNFSYKIVHLPRVSSDHCPIC